MKHLPQPMNKSHTELSSEVLDIALNAAYDGIFIYDKHATILYANEAALSLCGISKQAAIGRTYDELQRAGYFYGEAVLNSLYSKKIFSSEFINRIEKHLLCTAVPILDDNNEVQFVVTNVRDITNLFKLQKDLAEKKLLLNSVRDKLNKLQSSKNNDFVCSNIKMRKLLEMLDRVALTDVSVLLLGESGVGKSELALRIHKKSRRSSGNFIVVNCGAIPPSLCEAEFFGYEKGAFTGADRTKPGIFESADGGTLVLDEIGELPLLMQVKLLRVLQEGRVKRLGSQKELPVDFRLVSATNQNLREMVEKKLFRADLYHRINVIQFSIPPLKERPEDIKLLISYFLTRYNTKYGVIKTMSPELVYILEHYDWPGNSREMDHLIERLVVLSSSEEITSEYLPEEIGNHSKRPNFQTIAPLKDVLSETEKRLLRAAHEQLGTTRNMAKALQVSHVTIARKMKQYGIN